MMPKSDHGVGIERRGNVLVATIDRPEHKNALSTRAMKRLAVLAKEANDASDVRAVVIRSTGESVFVSGGDLKEFSELPASHTGARVVLEMGQSLRALERCEVPVIAAVQGVTMGGGCELILACDFVVVERQARFTFRQAAMGLSTGWGGGTRLVERVGSMTAARLLLTGMSVSAETALSMGLVTEVVSRGDSMARVLQIAAEIAQHPRASIRGLKQMLAKVRQTQRQNAHQLEAEVFTSLWGGEDHQAAVDEFFGRKRSKRG